MRGWEVWGSVAPEAHVEVDFGAWDCRFLRAETQAAGAKAPPSERLLGWGRRLEDWTGVRGWPERAPKVVWPQEGALRPPV